LCWCSSFRWCLRGLLLVSRHADVLWLNKLIGRHGLGAVAVYWLSLYRLAHHRHARLSHRWHWLTWLAHHRLAHHRLAYHRLTWLAHHRLTWLAHHRLARLAHHRLTWLAHHRLAHHRLSKQRLTAYRCATVLAFEDRHAHSNVAKASLLAVLADCGFGIHIPLLFARNEDVLVVHVRIRIVGDELLGFELDRRESFWGLLHRNFCCQSWHGQFLYRCLGDLDRHNDAFAFAEIVPRIVLDEAY